jgi:hypothetical protein
LYVVRFAREASKRWIAVVTGGGGWSGVPGGVHRRVAM